MIKQTRRTAPRTIESHAPAAQREGTVSLRRGETLAQLLARAGISARQLLTYNKAYFRHAKAKYGKNVIEVGVPLFTHRPRRTELRQDALEPRRAERDATRTPRASLAAPAPPSPAPRPKSHTSASKPATKPAPNAHGLVRRHGGMSIDSDGAPNITRDQDPWHQKETSMRWGGRSVDAASIPYIVMPLGQLPAGVRLGDLVRVTHNGRTAYAIVADRGGHDTAKRQHGEGSMALASMLGIDANPRSGGTSQGVTYEVLPGSGRQAGIYNGGPAHSAAAIQRLGAAAFART